MAAVKLSRKEEFLFSTYIISRINLSMHQINMYYQAIRNTLRLMEATIS